MFLLCLIDWGIKMGTIIWSPVLPSYWIILLAFAIFIPVIAMAVTRQRGTAFRLIAALSLLAALGNPSFQFEKREPLKDVVALVIDHTGSQSLSTRIDQTDKAVESVKKKLLALPNIEIRTIDVNDTNEDGTLAFHALQRGLSDIAPERLSGALLITDGQIDDVPKSVEALGFHAPLHALITGYEGERDRRIELIDTPQFGLVGKDQQIRLRITDPGSTAPIPVTVRRDGQPIAGGTAVPGKIITLPIHIEHGGPNLIEIEADPAADELTTINNKSVIAIEGIRDRLKVLLVSGVPHPGERTWRNTLKSDANVDLVHFTILRPPEKQDGTPVNELSLIAFPTRELFETKIADFDLIIFDRYADLAILPPAYFGNIVRYVRNGGALLIAAGPEFAGSESPAETPLRALLPAFPDGDIIEHPFLPRLTEAGKRHPVTRDLSGSATEPPQWGAWTRQISTGNISGTAIMSGDADKPLLILRHENKGRVALLLSDHAWLWARNFRGGGPHLDLLRRLGHWLMKEPQLEEEAIRASAHNTRLTIERQTMADTINPIILTAPNGQTQSISLQQTKPGLWRAELNPGALGLYRVSDGPLTAFAHLGPANPREFQNVLSTPERLAAITAATGGSVRRIAHHIKDTPTIQAILSLSGNVRYAGNDFIAFKNTDSSIIKGLSLWPIFIGFSGLALLMAGLLIGWLGESIGFRPQLKL
jgi:hypothetical protein